MFTTAVPVSQYTLPPRMTQVGHAPPARRRTGMLPVLAAVLAISAAYVYWHLGRGWIPHDDGALAQSAERVLQGQLPHRDYDEIYTGGLAYLDGAAFKLLGSSLWTMRLVLFAFFLAWVPAVFYAASRFVRPVVAGAVTLLAVAWSIPNYPTPMPSWYNLFFATFGIAALLRYVEDRHRRWLFAAGVAGGLSFLVKVIGLYYVAAATLVLVFQAHAEARAASPGQRRGIAYSAFVTVCLVAFVAAVIALIRNQPFAGEFVHFILPSAAIAALLIFDEWRLPAGTSRERFAALARLLVPFLIGVVLPIALYLIPYARAGALGDFVNGIFILPTKRFSSAVVRIFPLAAAVTLIPIGLLVAIVRRRTRSTYLEIVSSIIVVALLVWASRSHPVVYRLGWYSARMLVPVLVLAGAIVLRHRRAADEEDPLLRARTMILLSVTALCSLVQFPFAGHIYFCYVAPIAVLLAVAMVRYLRPRSPVIPLATLGFYAAFAVMRLNTATIYSLGLAYQPFPRTLPITTERAGISATAGEAREHDVLVALVRQHARGGYLWASPDCPQVYYLAGLNNPTRSLFEFFADTAGYERHVLEMLDSKHVTAVVLNKYPDFSPGISHAMFVELVRRYPYGEEVGRFHVRWRL